MAMSEYTKVQIEQRKLDRKFDEIEASKAREMEKKFKKSYAMHTPPEALKDIREGKETMSWYPEK